MADVDKDLAKALQAARKKPRNFAIIANGANVLKLLIDKKPIKDGTVMAAKKDCQGKAVVKGVVSGGDGPELVFQVTEEPAVGEVKLRKFITDETQLVLKARFEVVANLQGVDDQDDEAATAVADAAQSQAKPESVAPSVPDGTATAGKTPSADQLVAALKKLSPVIERAVAAHPQHNAEILRPVAAFQTHVEAGALPQAKEALLQIGTLLKTLKTEPGAPDEAAPEDPAKKAWEARWTALEPAYLKILPSQPADVDKMRAIAGYAQQQAAAGQYAKAVAALDRLQPMIAAASQSAREPLAANGGEAGAAQGASSLVNLQKARLAWDRTRKEIQSELQRLEQAILQQCAAEPDFREIANGTKNLYTMLDTLDMRLIDKLDEALNAKTSADRDAFHMQTLEIVDEYVDFVNDDDLVNDIDTNGFIVIEIKPTLTATLKEISKRLAV